MSKVFAFSTRARPKVSQCCAARLRSGNGCSGNEGRPKATTHKRNKGKAGWREKMESRFGEVPSSLHAVRVTQFLNYRGLKVLTLYSYETASTTSDWKEN